MKVHELISELEVNSELEFDNEVSVAFKLGEISERNRILKSLEKSSWNGYCHKTSDNYTHFDWHRTVSSIIHELKIGKL